MGIKLADAFVALGAKREGLTKDLGEAHKETTAWTVAVGTAMGNLMGGIIQKGAELATKAVTGLVKSVVGLTVEAAKVEGMRNTFSRLAQSVGGDARSAMEDLRYATRGMVADADLMAAGNKFLAMGLADTTEQAAELSEIATQLGMAMGEDATASMENFALMLANQSIPRLDSFGISSGTVRARIEELRNTTAGLTQEQAFMQAVMEQARVTMEKVGEQGGTAGASLAKINASFSNIKATIGEAFLPIGEQLLGWFGTFVEYIDFTIRSGDSLNDSLADLPEGLKPIAKFFGDLVATFRNDVMPAMEGVSVVLQGIVSGDFGTVLNGIEQALLSLGVPAETVEKIITIINTLWSAFQDLKNGNVEETIGKVKAVLLELGVPIETIDAVEKKIRELFAELEWFRNAATIWWIMNVEPILDGIREWFAENLPKAWAGAKAAWEELLKPALEGLWLLVKDVASALDGALKPALIALAPILVATAAPFALLALQVAALAIGIIGLGLIWGEFGDEVKTTVMQLDVIVRNAFKGMIDSAIALLSALSFFPDLLGIRDDAIRSLQGLSEQLNQQNIKEVEEMKQIPQRGSTFNPGENWEWLMELLRGDSSGQGPAHQQQSMTVYGGVNIYPEVGNPDALAQLWEQGL